MSFLDFMEDFDLINKSDDEQISIMRKWFYANYEDPAHSLPHDSKEGGYQFIYGGPYNARDVLNEKYEDSVSKKNINKLVKELENDSSIWTPRLDGEIYRDFFYDIIAANTSYHATLTENFDDVSKILIIQVKTNERRLLLNVLFVNVITSLETFLADAFIHNVIENPQLLRRFVESNPDFKERTFRLDEIFTISEQIKKEVRNYLVDLIWHNLSKVMKMYESTFDISIESNLQYIYKSIAIRHDIVHRNGKTKGGNQINITDSEIRKLMHDVRVLADEIDKVFGV